MITFFNIPIYSCSEKCFDEQYGRKILDKINSAQNEVLETYLRKKEGSKLLWQYNQIIGFIKVYYDDYEIKFDIFLPSEKRIDKLSDKKRWLHETLAPVRHISLAENNEGITDGITRTLKAIKKDYLKNYYLDLSNYNIIKDYINYLEVISKMTLE